jgi:hypothetical protein
MCYSGTREQELERLYRFAMKIFSASSAQLYGKPGARLSEKKFKVAEHADLVLIL